MELHFSLFQSKLLWKRFEFGLTVSLTLLNLKLERLRLVECSWQLIVSKSSRVVRMVKNLPSSL